MRRSSTTWSRSREWTQSSNGKPKASARRAKRRRLAGRFVRFHDVTRLVTVNKDSTSRFRWIVQTPEGYSAERCHPSIVLASEKTGVRKPHRSGWGLVTQSRRSCSCRGCLGSWLAMKLMSAFFTASIAASDGPSCVGRMLSPARASSIAGNGPFSNTSDSGPPRIPRGILQRRCPRLCGHK